MNNTFRKYDLSGKTALVTGGATGIGYYMARGLAAAGARVMISARRENVLKDSASRLGTETGGDALYHVVDLANPKSVRDLVDHAISTLNGVDILVGNAAMIVVEPLESIKDETLAEMFQVNVAANVALVRGFLPHMRTNKWGRIIISSSTASMHGAPSEPVSMYSMVKGALNSFVRAVAVEVGRDGITANSLVLGMHKTELVEEIVGVLDAKNGQGAGEAWLQAQASMTATGHIAESADAEGMVQLLASDAGRNITGANLVLDGGHTIMMRPYQTP